MGFRFFGDDVARNGAMKMWKRCKMGKNKNIFFPGSNVILMKSLFCHVFGVRKLYGKLPYVTMDVELTWQWTGEIFKLQAP